MGSPGMLGATADTCGCDNMSSLVSIDETCLYTPALMHSLSPKNMRQFWLQQLFQ